MPFIEGDGIGVDITPVMIKVIDASIKKAYAGERKISWMKCSVVRKPLNFTKVTGSQLKH